MGDRDSTSVVVENVFARLSDGRRVRFFRAKNIITSAGDVYYAQRAVGGTPTNAFGLHVLCSAGPAVPGKGELYGDFTPIAGSSKLNDSGYPQANNQDAENTGKGVSIVTHKATYSRGAFSHDAITHGLITIPAPVAGSPLLCGYEWEEPFDKTPNDSLIIYVNHSFLGV